MFIRSQDGLNLVNVDQIQGIAAESLPHDVSITADGILLGIYDTQETVGKILNDLEHMLAIESVNNDLGRLCRGATYKMPKNGEV